MPWLVLVLLEQGTGNKLAINWQRSVKRNQKTFTKGDVKHQRKISKRPTTFAIV